MSLPTGNILIVDDDPNITELLQVNLRSEGYAVSVTEHAADVQHDNLGEVRLVIVDAMRQDPSGLDLVYELKDDPVTEHIAIILYSSIKSERMVIDALDAGADDYVTKPFSLRELLARVKSVLRRHAPRAGSNVLKFMDMSLDLGTQVVKIGGVPVALSKTEFAILAMLVKNTDNFVSRSDIYRRVWGGDTDGSNERVVDTNISRLRKKLGDTGSHIVNRSGYGYMIS